MPQYPPLLTSQLDIVDADGRPRIRLSADSLQPTFQMLGVDGAPAIELTLDSNNHPSVKLTNPDPSSPNATLEIDAKGVHVKFDRPGGASAYLFLNDAGASGLVLIDQHGVRRLGATVSPEGAAKIEPLGS